jgi:hypothetical protein
MSGLEAKVFQSFLQRGRRVLGRFSDTGIGRLSTHSGGRRLKSAKAGNRGGWGTGGAAGSMGIWPRGAAREGMAAVAGPVGLAQRLGGRAGMNE